LRAAGHYLDRSSRRLASVFVVDDGVVVTLAPRGPRRTGEAFLLSHENLRRLTAEGPMARGVQLAFRDPLFPTGYENFLRVLGLVASQQAWTGLRVVRVGTTLLLHYSSRQQRMQLVLRPEDVQHFLSTALRQRGHG
jgi:hypothetical protein